MNTDAFRSSISPASYQRAAQEDRCGPRTRLAESQRTRVRRRHPSVERLHRTRGKSRLSALEPSLERQTERQEVEEPLVLTTS